MGASYASVQELRSRIDKLSTTDDPTLQAILDAASEKIDRHCNRAEGFVANSKASARNYCGSGEVALRIDECVEVTAVRLRTSATDTWETLTTVDPDYRCATGDKRAPDYNRTPYTLLVLDPNGDYDVWYDDKPHITVEVTAKWGYALAVPPSIREACAMQAARWYKRFQSAMSDTLASGELGMLLYRQSLDPDIKGILVDGRFVKPSVGRRY